MDHPTDANETTIQIPGNQETTAVSVKQGRYRKGVLVGWRRWRQANINLAVQEETHQSVTSTEAHFEEITEANSVCPFSAHVCDVATMLNI